MSDSRFHSQRPGPDPLGVRLDALRAETDRCSMPPAGSIRRRGDRRSAIQVASTTLAAASVIGLGAFVLPLGGADRGEPIDLPTTSTSPPPIVVPTLSPDVLLDVPDLDGIDPYTDQDSQINWAEDSTHDDPGLALSSVCLPRMSSPDATQSLAREYVVTGGAEPPLGVASRAAEVVLVLPKASAAEATMDSLRGWLLSCGQVDERTAATAAWTLDGAGTGGFAVEVLASPGSDGGTNHQVAVGRSGPVVVGVLLTTTSLDGNTPDRTLDLLRFAMAKLCQVTSPPCLSGDITAERVALDTPGGGSSTQPPFDDPLLGLADLPTWGGVLPWDTSFDVEDVAAGPYGVVCHPLWRDLGGTSERQRQFSVVTGTDPGDEPSATEVIAEFADQEAALDAIETMSIAMTDCVAGGQLADGITVEPVGLGVGAGIAWLVTMPSGGTAPDQRILLGLVHSGARTAMVTISYALPEPLDAEPFDFLLSIAAVRLTQ